MTSPGSGIALGLAAACAPQPVEFHIDPNAACCAAPPTFAFAQSVVIGGHALCCNCGAGTTATGQHAEWCASRSPAWAYPTYPQQQYWMNRVTLGGNAPQPISDADVDRIARRVVELLDAREKVAKL